MDVLKECYKKTICLWPKEDRPREKLLKYGEHKLSNSELLAVILRTGVSGETAIDLARKILAKFGSFREMSKADNNEWLTIRGLGEAKISQIKAAIELGRRFREDEASVDMPQVRSSRDIADIMSPRMRDLKREVFKVIHLDAQNRIIEIVEESEGTVNQANPIIREICQKALLKYSSSIICVHNHPSGGTDPSSEDRSFTRKLFDACKIMQINMLDHIIIGNDSYYSFADNGTL